MEELPGTAFELIEALDKAFPVPRFRPTDDYGMIMFKSGERAIVDKLLHLLKKDRR